jgi:two-component system, OmpR family, phosphate regulon sensor histidine kinase PhoR
MSRRFFAGLVIMMALSIIGITWVQINWIRNAVSMVNENFNNAVFVSLNNAANEIESLRKMNFFNNYGVSNHFISQDSSGNVQGYFSFGSSVSVGGNSFSINFGNNQYVRSRNSSHQEKPDLGKHLLSPGKNLDESDSLTLIITSPDSSGNIRIVNQGIDVSSENEPGINIHQKEYLDWAKRRSAEISNLSGQMIAELYQWEKTMELDNNEISSALRQYLNYSGVNTPFEFAVIKNGVVGEGTFRKASKNEFLKSPYKVSLFPDNIIKRDVLLSVVFPERTNYVMGSMTWILGGSLLFSLFIFSTFALSLYFIIRQKKISEMKSDFINNMTHEFKTPIATISLAADTITNSRVINDENSIRHFIGMIKKENSRMNKQVETILQIASLDKKEIEFSFDRTSLHMIIERAVETIEIQVQQRQGNLKVELNANNDVVFGDSEHLISLVHNLLDNAIKYSPAAPEIKVQTSNARNGVLLAVEDKGIGMTKSVQSKIFERFYRLSSGNIHDVKGFGLGLNYVRAIVDAHKGEISVISEPGKGSRFEIFLPFNSDN